MTKETPKQTNTQTKVVTAGSTIRIEQPKSSRGKQPRVSVIVASDEVVREHVGGFLNFLREHTIVGLAVGFVIATQVQGVVKQLTDGFINPLFQLLFGGKSLSQRTFTLQLHGRHAAFIWGSVAYALIDFLFVMIVLYAVIKIFNLDKLDKPAKSEKSNKD